MIVWWVKIRASIRVSIYRWVDLLLGESKQEVEPAELHKRLSQHTPSLIFGGQDVGDSTRNRDEAIRRFQADETRVAIEGNKGDG